MPSLKWTDTEIRADAKLYDTKVAWRKGSPGAENAARRRGITYVNDVCSHMIVLRKGHSTRTLRESARRYNTKPEWRRGDRIAYLAAYKKGKTFVDSICSHMPQAAHVMYDTEEAISAKAKEYATRTAWMRGHKHSYELSLALGKKKHGANCAHMRKYVNPGSRFTKTICRSEAKKFRTKTEWATSAPGSYQAARRLHGKAFFDKCCSHMMLPKTWTKAHVVKTASAFKRISDWREAYPGQYLAAHRRGWMKEATQHMRVEDKGVPTSPRYLYRIDSTITIDGATMRYIYVGLTAHRNKRMSVHACATSDKSWLMALPSTKVVWTGPFAPLEAARREQNAIKYWRGKETRGKSVCVLNRNSGGGLGGFGRVSALEKALPPAFPSAVTTVQDNIVLGS